MTDADLRMTLTRDVMAAVLVALEGVLGADCAISIAVDYEVQTGVIVVNANQTNSLTVTVQGITLLARQQLTDLDTLITTIEGGTPLPEPRS